MVTNNQQPKTGKNKLVPLGAGCAGHNRCSLTGGLSTIELLIAFAVIILALTGVMGAVFGNQSIALDAELNNLALYKAEEKLEDIFAEVRSGGFETLTLSGPPVVDGIFSVATSVHPISDCAKRVVSKSWWTDNGFVKDVSVATVFTSIDALKKSGNNCDPTGGGPFDNPDTIGSFPSPPTHNINPTAVDVVRRDGKRLVFMTSLDNNESELDLWVIDATDEANPVQIASINAGGCRNIGGGPKLCGLTDVVVGGDYVYVTSASSTKTESSHEVEVYDISGLPSLPSTPVGTITLGITPTCPGAYCPGGAQSIEYHNNRIYVGTHRVGGPEFFIIDADPSSLAILGKVSPGYDHNVNDIVVWDDYAYLATSDNAGELHVIDVSGDAVNTIYLHNVSGNADATALVRYGSNIYLGRERDSSNPDLFTLDVSDVGAIGNALPPIDMDEKLCYEESTHLPQSCLGPNTAVEGIAFKDTYVFLATSKQTAGFQVWERKESGLAPISECNSYNYSEKATDIDFFDDFGFISNKSNDPLRIIYDQPSVCTP